MCKRTGATLVEVLVAIFIMGIGLLALLALFPLGVLNMAQAIQSDRAALCATNASSCAVALNLHRDPALVDTVVGGVVTPGPFTNPAPGDPKCNSATATAPSWPVFVDSVGQAQVFGPWVGGVQYGIPRLSPNYITTNANPTKAIRQWFTLLDDIRFDVNAAPAAIGTNLFDREGNYSWAYLLRRPLNGNTAAVNMDIVVYSRRQLNLSQTLAPPEYAYPNCQFDPAQPNIVRFTWGGGQNPPAVRAGSWVLDASPQPTGAGANPTYNPSHAQFYRIVGVNEVAGSSTALDVELQDPVQGFPVVTNNATFLVLDGVVDVIPRGTQWRP
jgi:hypothetical protein